MWWSVKHKPYKKSCNLVGVVLKYEASLSVEDNYFGFPQRMTIRREIVTTYTNGKCNPKLRACAKSMHLRYAGETPWSKDTFVSLLQGRLRHPYRIPRTCAYYLAGAELRKLHGLNWLYANPAPSPGCPACWAAHLLHQFHLLPEPPLN